MREQTKRAMLSWGGLFKKYDGDPACFKENEFARSLDRAYLGVSTNSQPLALTAPLTGNILRMTIAIRWIN